jgi:hypothetical protein
MGDALKLARGDAESLPGVVAEPAESETVMRLPFQERAGKPAEHATARRLLAREQTKVAIDHERTLAAVEVPELVVKRRREDRGRHRGGEVDVPELGPRGRKRTSARKRGRHHGANNKRKSDARQEARANQN